MKTLFRDLSPPAILALSFLFLIGLGSVLLYLPFTHFGSLSYLDALFTSTSAVCVTGLIVADTGTKFTLWGQIVIIVLIQLGGLGLMTFSTVVLMLLGKSPSFKGRLVLQDTLTHSPTKDLFSLVKSVVLFTFITETIGCLILTLHWTKAYPLSKAFFYGFFHSISAFCNAGFSLFSNSLEDFKADSIVLLTISFLIIFGGIGFLVVTECIARLYEKKKRFSLHTKLTLITTTYLIVISTFLILIFEYHNTLYGLSIPEKLINALFQAVTPRTAGFNSLPMAKLTEHTLFLFILLMFIGASPGSCGGGIKTTTFAVFLSIIWNKIKGREKNHILHRTLPLSTVDRAFSVTTLSSLLVIVCLFLLLLTQAYGISHSLPSIRFRFLDYLFETVSAFGTVGLSTGVTSTLNSIGKLIIIVLMFIGRVGPLTIVHLVKIREVAKRYQYAEERVMIG